MADGTREYDALISEFVRRSSEILGELLFGIYLHGSLAMGCFNKEKSDVDLIVAVTGEVRDDVKRRYMDMVVELDKKAPAKGIEMSVVKAEVCRRFSYPTPFELHFSNAHLPRYISDPDGYVAEMKGTDRDLAAHFTVIQRRGRTLFGPDIADLFGEVPAEYYLDSILYDVGDAERLISSDPVYFILNLCRVLAHVREGAVLSKKEGGEWGAENVPGELAPLVAAALSDYEGRAKASPDFGGAGQFAAYMLGEIRKSAGSAGKFT